MGALNSALKSAEKYEKDVIVIDNLWIHSLTICALFLKNFGSKTTVIRNDKLETDDLKSLKKSFFSLHLGPGNSSEAD